MPAYLYHKKYVAQQDICKTLDTSFLLEIVDDFKKILTFMPSGLFPATVTADIKYEADAQATEQITLSLQGSVMFIYYRVYGEAYPQVPTAEQIQKINDIWIGIGHPENIITI